MQLKVEHNLTDKELKKAIVGMTEASGLTAEVMEALSKACSCDDIPKEPNTPAIRELYSRFRKLYRDAAEWLESYISSAVTVHEKKELSKARAYRDTPLTNDEIKVIQWVIRDRFDYLSWQMGGEQHVSTETLDRWKALGLVDKSITTEALARQGGLLVYDAFVFGKVHEAVETGKSFDEALKLANELPLLPPDWHAIAVAEQQAGNHITGFADDLAKEIGRQITEKNRLIVKDMAVDFHSRRLKITDAYGQETGKVAETWRQFSSELGHTFDDFSRDWDKIAFTELTDSQKQGQALELMERKGPQTLVYKKPLPTACPQCKHLYLEADGVTPKLFKLDEMLSHGNNIGRKPMPVRGGKVANLPRPDGEETLKPVAGVVHPYCQCLGPYLYTGMESWVRES